MKIILLILALCAAGTAVAATMTPQIGGGINQFDGGVASQGSASGGGATPCSGTGLIFTSACNSQYIGIL